MMQWNLFEREKRGYGKKNEMHELYNSIFHPLILIKICQIHGEI